jgi:hypothetical protein
MYPPTTIGEIAVKNHNVMSIYLGMTLWFYKSFVHKSFILCPKIGMTSFYKSFVQKSLLLTPKIFAPKIPKIRSGKLNIANNSPFGAKHTPPVTKKQAFSRQIFN